jgi:hypothetical protein
LQYLSANLEVIKRQKLQKLIATFESLNPKIPAPGLSGIILQTPGFPPGFEPTYYDSSGSR